MAGGNVLIGLEYDVDPETKTRAGVPVCEFEDEKVGRGWVMDKAAKKYRKLLWVKSNSSAHLQARKTSPASA